MHTLKGEALVETLKVETFPNFWEQIFKKAKFTKGNSSPY